MTVAHFKIVFESEYLSASRKLIVSHLAFIADDNGEAVFPGYQHLSRVAQSDPDKVEDEVRLLLALELLGFFHRDGVIWFAIDLADLAFIKAAGFDTYREREKPKGGAQE